MYAHHAPLSDGRWHFQHGPIDIVIGADGDCTAVAAAHAAAWCRFRTILDELVAELPALRRPVGGPCPVSGTVAWRMWQACLPYRDVFITPMAAVAGAVAQELISSYERPGVHRAWVNNGGDVALALAPGARLSVGLYADIGRFDLRQALTGITPDGRFELRSEWPVRGVATSGWRGRSFSLGVADSVTVLARSAAEADAAATMIANAVDADDRRILRRPACELKDDSDLGDLPVTVDVPPLGAATVAAALERGRARAEGLRRAGLVWAAVLMCQGQVRCVGDILPLRPPVPAAALA